MNSWTVYLITRLDAVQVFFCVIGGLFFLFCFTAVVVYTIEPKTETIRILKTAIVGLVASILFLTATPSTNEAVMIYILPKIINNETVKQIPENAANLINEQVKIWLENLSKSNQKPSTIKE